MNMLTKRIELIANVAIIVVAVLLTGVLVRNYLLAKTPERPPPASSSILPGTKLSLPGVDWKANGKTLVLALSTGCHFCTESAPFYQRLAQERAKNSNLRLVAVFPQSISDGQNYLAINGVSVDQVTQARLDLIGVEGTPTLIITDANGGAVNAWRGRLPAEKESEVLDSLQR